MHCKHTVAVARYRVQAHVANMKNTRNPASQPQSSPARQSQESHSVDMIVIVSRLQTRQPLAAYRSGMDFSDPTQLGINWGSKRWGVRCVHVPL